MARPRLLDLFCGAGGAAMGYHRAGFDVVGVDIAPQPHYPFEFIQADALWALGNWGDTVPVSEGFDVIHASPPCQGYSIARNNGSGKDAPLLIAETRALLKATGLPYIIENVEGAAAHMDHPVRLCGASFGLTLAGMDLSRHRLFETNFPLLVPACPHEAMPKRYRVMRHGTTYMSRYAPVYGDGGGKAMGEWADAMGIDWMTHSEMAEAIPPAYTQHIGVELIEQLRRAVPHG